MFHAHRVRRFCKPIGISVCWALLSSVLVVPPPTSGRGKNGNRPRQAERGSSSGQERRVIPTPPRQGPPAVGLPNLDQVRHQTNPRSAKAVEPIPSTMRRRNRTRVATTSATKETAAEVKHGNSGSVRSHHAPRNLSLASASTGAALPFVPQSGRTNFALANNGGLAAASSSYPSTPTENDSSATATNGDRKGKVGSIPSVWNSAAPGHTFDDWLQVDFSGSRVIDEIDVITIQDNWQNPSEPTEAMTFSTYGITSYDVQFWNPVTSGWATVPSGSVSGNNKVWRQFIFASVPTNKVRILIHGSGDGYSRIAELEAWGTLEAGSSSGFAMARLDPHNRTGTGGEDLLSNNFNWSLPLVSLPGRGGLDLGLELSYNSLVWTRSGNYVDFDLDQGSVAPGFRLGFPTIEGPYWNNQANANFYMLVTPSGATVELRQSGSTNVYESKDSTYLQLIDNLNGTMTLRPTDGSQMNFISVGGGWRCNKITDRNGNYISVTYKSWGEIETATDTLGRVLTFNYDANANIQSITQNWNGQTHQWATFGWGTASIGHNFPTLTNLGADNTSIPVLTQVGLPDGSRFNFDYNSCGQVATIHHYAYDPNNSSHERNRVTYVYSADGTDSPRVTQRQDHVEYWTGVNGVPDPVATSFTHDADGGCRLTLPDSTVYKEFYGTGWQGGLTTESRNYASVADANSNLWQKKSTMQWTQDNTGVTYQTNPRVTETNVYDSSGNRRRTTIDYRVAPYAQYGLPYFVTEYGPDGTTEIRRAYTDYNLSQTYLDRRIIGLVAAVHLTHANGYQGKVTYGYDDPGRLNSQATTATMHDQSYNGSFTMRGNVTSVSRWDVTDINTIVDPSKALTTTMNYNAAGSIVSTSDPAGHTNSIGYTDSFSATGTTLDEPRSFATFAYPTTATDADGFSSFVRYNYDFGAKTRVEGPPPQNQPNGAIQTFSYDSAARLERVTTLNNGAYTRYVYGPYWVQSFSTVNTVTDDAYSISVFDGAGRAFGTANNHPGSVGGYRLVNTVFDRMGRAVLETRPFEIDSSWTAAGDDFGGVPPTAQTYDWKGRPLRTTNPDGTYKEASYAGCGCAGGEVVTLTDEVGRRQKIYSDVLGREWKNEVLNWDGSVYATTTNSLNGRDQATNVKAYAGVAPAEASSTNENASCTDGSCQKTTMSYDGYGRLQTQHVPEQDAGTATVYTYNADDTMQSVTDARGASATYGYNNRHLVTSINYSAPTGITATAPVSFAYDAAGNRISMSDGVGSQSYRYDSLSRMTSETRSFTGLTNSYTLSYAYNLGNELTSISLPTWSQQIGYNYDASGRSNSVTGSGFQSNNFATNLQYRAWGAVKQIDYGNGAHLNLGYNCRLQVTNSSLSRIVDESGGQTTMLQSFDYHAEGRVNHAFDPNRNVFDRAYEYDHAGRLNEAYSGSQARGGATNDGPYRQSYSYDAFSNLRSRVNFLWGNPVNPDSASYTNNRNSNYQYDADGNATWDGNEHSYDAADRQSGSTVLDIDALTTVYITQSYDGDGRAAKRTEHRVIEQGNGSTQEQWLTTHFLTSTVLNGAAIVELDGYGYKQELHVYAGGQLLAQERQVASWAVEWRYANPATGSWVEMNQAGATSRREMDPLGADLTTNPWPLYQNPNYLNLKDNGQRLYDEGDDPFNVGSGCSLDGMPISCSELERHAEAGAVALEYLFHDGNRWRVEQAPIVSHGLGIFESERPYLRRNNEWRRGDPIYDVRWSAFGFSFNFAPPTRGGEPQYYWLQTPRPHPDVERLLGNPDCEKFLNDLLNELSKFGEPYSRNFRTVYAAAEPFFRYHSYPKDSSVVGGTPGRILGDPHLEIFLDAGKAQPGTWFALEYTAVHEIVHVAATSGAGYEHVEMARTAYAVAPAEVLKALKNSNYSLPPDLSGTHNADVYNSNLFDRILFHACPPRKK